MNPLQELLIQIEEQDAWQEELNLGRNEYLNKKGKINTDIHFVSVGSLRVYALDEKEEHTIRFGYQNSVITALDSFITNEPSNYFIQALKKTTIKVIDKNQFMTIINSSPENQQYWQLIMEQLIYQQLEREIDLLTSSPSERYKRVLKRSPQLFQEIPSKYIASYLRMTPETLSRIRGINNEV